jgi:hypothetical protein
VPKSAASLLNYSITLSARTNNVSGTVTPIALAVLRLTTNSNFVGCSTGMSATLMAPQSGPAANDRRDELARPDQLAALRITTELASLPVVATAISAAFSRTNFYRCPHDANVSSNALASVRSVVSRPSVNQL